VAEIYSHPDTGVLEELDGFEAFEEGEESPILEPIERQTDVYRDFLLGRIATEISDHKDRCAENTAREIVDSARVDLSAGRIALEGLESIQEIIYGIFPNLIETPKLNQRYN